MILWMKPGAVSMGTSHLLHHQTLELQKGLQGGRNYDGHCHENYCHWNYRYHCQWHHYKHYLDYGRGGDLIDKTPNNLKNTIFFVALYIVNIFTINLMAHFGCLDLFLFFVNYLFECLLSINGTQMISQWNLWMLPPYIGGWVAALQNTIDLMAHCSRYLCLRHILILTIVFILVQYKSSFCCTAPDLVLT